MSTVLKNFSVSYLKLLLLHSPIALEVVCLLKRDVLINNAGEYVYSKSDEIKFEDLEHTLAVNLKAPIYLTKCVIPHMKENGWGRIINIGSISGVMGEAYASVYSSSKAGLIGLTKALALELAEFNITVNTINPGWVETELGMKSIEESEFSKEEIIECIPQKRFVKPEEIAKLCKYLISSSVIAPALASFNNS